MKTTDASHLTALLWLLNTDNTLRTENCEPTDSEEKMWEADIKTTARKWNPTVTKCQCARCQDVLMYKGWLIRLIRTCEQFTTHAELTEKEVRDEIRTALKSDALVKKVHSGEYPVEYNWEGTERQGRTDLCFETVYGDQVALEVEGENCKPQSTQKLSLLNERGIYSFWYCRQKLTNRVLFRDPLHHAQFEERQSLLRERQSIQAQKQETELLKQQLSALQEQLREQSRLTQKAQVKLDSSVDEGNSDADHSADSDREETTVTRKKKGPQTPPEKKARLTVSAKKLNRQVNTDRSE
jgi:hypothetical protein